MDANLKSLGEAFEPFRHLEPAGWFSLATHFDRPVVMGLVAGGAVMLLLGVNRWVFRVVAPLLGALTGLVVATPIAELAGKASPFPPAMLAWLVPGLLALLAAFVPQLALFAVMGALGAATGYFFIGGSEALMVGALPGLIVVGVLGVVFSRVFGAIASAGVGAILVISGAMVLLAKTPAGALLASPLAPSAAAAVLLCLGAALQLAMTPTEEADAKGRAEKHRKKVIARDDRERADRFSELSKRAK